MLILVGVTVTTSINGELFKTAKEASKSTEKQSISELIIGTLSYNDLGDIDKKETWNNIESISFEAKLLNPKKEDDIEDTENIIFSITGKLGTYTYKLNSENVEIVDSVAKYIMQIGDYVNYDAGTWDETVATPTEETPYTFGGYTAGASRNESVLEINVENGWRVFDMSDDGTTVTLISAGCPEIFYTGENVYNSYRILTGEKNSNVNSDLPSEPRDYSCYVNVKQYGSSAKVVRKSDLRDFCYINLKPVVTGWSRPWDTLADGSLDVYNDQSLGNIININADYWLSNIQWDMIGVVNKNSTALSYNAANGIRILVTLKNPKFKDEATEIETGGFKYNSWEIIEK